MGTRCAPGSKTVNMPPCRQGEAVPKNTPLAPTPRLHMEKFEPMISTVDSLPKKPNQP
jgi:hypothetical protein